MQAYAIAQCDRVPDEAFYRRVSELAAFEVSFIQLRAKTFDDRDLLHVASRLREIIPAGKTRFLINSRPDIAVAVSADGVHLPSLGVPVAAARALPGALKVGRSCHNLAECARAVEEGADYILLGPVFAPRSKEGRGTVALSELRDSARLGVPVFALGGISRENLDQFRGLPIAGVAGITLFMKDDPLRAILDAVTEL